MNNKFKTVVITGGLGGIGMSLVNFFYDKGYNIIIIDNKNKIFFSKLDFKKKKKFYQLL